MIGEVSLAACGKCSGFFMPHVNPFELIVSADSVGERVEGVSGHSIDALDAGIDQHANENFGSFHGKELLGVTRT